MLKKCLRPSPGPSIHLLIQEDRLIHFKFPLLDFKTFFLFWVAVMILEALDVELEWAHSFGYHTNLKTLWDSPLLLPRVCHSLDPLSGRMIWFNFGHHLQKLYHFTPSSISFHLRYVSKKILCSKGVKIEAGKGWVVKEWEF